MSIDYIGAIKGLNKYRGVMFGGHDYSESFIIRKWEKKI